MTGWRRRAAIVGAVAVGWFVMTLAQIAALELAYAAMVDRVSCYYEIA